MDLQVLHDELHEKIDEIDAKLDSQTDAKTAGKRSIINGLIEDSSGTWTPVSEQLIAQLTSAPVDVQIGVYYGLLRQLNKAFSKPLGDAVETMVESIPETPVEKIPDDVLEELGKARSALYAKVKQLVEMDATFNNGAGNMRMPKRRTGGRGKRGARAISSFNWEIDGTSYDKLKDVAEVYDQYEATKDLTAAMRAAGLDLKNPSDRIEFTLPDGNILVGVRDTEKVADSNSADDDGDDDDDEETTEA